MVNNLLAFKDTVIKKFGPVLGYVILAICALAVLSLLGVLFRTIIGIVIGVAIASLVIFGVYKVYQMLSSKKSE